MVRQRLASNLGSLIQGVGAAWMMTSISNSADLVALVQASTTLPIMLFSLVSGAIADDYNRRAVMLVAQCFMLVVSVALMLAAYADIMTPWLLLSFTFLIGCGTALNNPSWQAAVGDMVPRDYLPAAVALNSMSFNLTRSVGPAIGGVIVATAGAAAAFAANTVSYFALIIVLFRWKPVLPPSTLPREIAGPRDIGRTALRRDVAQHRKGAAARLRLRRDRNFDPGAIASCRPRHRATAARCSTACCLEPMASAQSAARCSAAGCAASSPTNGLPVSAS